MRSLLPLFVLSLCAACATKRSTVVTEEPVVKPQPTAEKKAPPDPVAPREELAAETPVKGPLYYSLDSALLTPESQAVLDALAKQLRRHSDWTVRLEGHTCELGTSEYNLDLGQKRAASARRYLETLGVAGSRLSTLSYGEERPAVQGEDEAARAKNRRTELSLLTEAAR